jgi:radical SAM superfamily enzyme YgiQ (UPF0313 family)
MASSSSGSTSFRAAVIVPSVHDFYFTPSRFSCLGAHLVADILREHTFSVDLFEFPLMQKKAHVIDLPRELAYLQEYVVPNETGKQSYFTDFKRFGPTIDECGQQIAQKAPDYCFICSFAFSYAKETIDIAKVIKKLLPKAVVIVGGAGPSAYPLYFTKNTAVDYVVAGEAEVSLPLFCNYILNQGVSLHTIPNIYYREDGCIRSSIVKTYTCAHEILPVIHKTVGNNKRIRLSMSITRGCDKKCRFCSNHLTHGSSFRKASIESINSMVKSIFIDENLPVTINFEDDNLLSDPDYFFSVIEILKKKFVTVSFAAENGLDYSLLTPLLADKLIESGFLQFNFTLGSISNVVLQANDRTGSLHHFETIVRHICERNIPVLAFFICGLKDDSVESTANVLAYLLALPSMVKSGISMFYAIPGLPDFADTALFDRLSPVHSNGSSAYPWYGSLSTNELITAFRLSRFINLVKSSRRSELENDLIKKSFAEKKLFTQVMENGKVKTIEVPQADPNLIEMFFEKAF